MIKNLLLLGTLTIIIPCYALDTETYDAFVNAIEHCDEQEVIRLKSLHALSHDEKEKLYGIAYATAYELQQYKKRWELYYYKHIWSAGTLPKALQHLEKDTLTYISGRICILSNLANIIGLIVIEKLPIAQKLNVDKKKLGLTYMLLCSAVMLTSGFIWTQKRTEWWEFQPEVEIAHIIALRILTLLDT